MPAVAVCLKHLPFHPTVEFTCDKVVKKGTLEISAKEKHRSWVASGD
jgi:hypothetical protein